MSSLAGPCARGVRAWNAFWFEADGRAQVRVFRVSFGLLLFVCYLLRSLDLDLFYGASGIMPLSVLTEVAPMEYRFSIFRILTGTTALWAGNVVFLLSLLAFAFGFFPRAAVLVAWFLHVSFVHRNLSIAYGVDMVSCFFLFYLCFADYRTDVQYRAGDLRATLGSVSYRLFQIQICIIYGFSGLKKLKGHTWWNGEALWYSLAHPQLARWDFSGLAEFPLLLAFATYLSLAWEIYFPALIWIAPIRKPLLLFGIAMHVGIGIGLSLPFFAILMVLTYVFFLDRETLVSLFRPIRAKVPA